MIYLFIYWFVGVLFTAFIFVTTTEQEAIALEVTASKVIKAAIFVPLLYPFIIIFSVTTATKR